MEYDTAFFRKGSEVLALLSRRDNLTSVEFINADIYKDLDAVETAFKRLVNLIPHRDGSSLFDGATGDATESASLERCLSRAFSPVERYGSSATADWKITNLKLEAGKTS